MKDPQHDDPRRWLRHLHGELPADEARELERRLAADGGLADRYRRFADTWNRLEEPPVVAVPEDFSARVVAAARALGGRRTGELSWALAPAWARAGSVAALVAGLALGVAIGGNANGEPELDDAGQEVYALSQPISLAESFWLALEENDGGLDDGDATGEPPR